DPQLRGETRAELLALHDRLHATMVYVTHDQEEAMTLGQRIAVLRAGRMEQVASPSDLYEQPANTFVARFIGSPPMNLLEGRVANQDGSIAFDTAGQKIALGPAAPSYVPMEASVLGVRPHDLRPPSSQQSHFFGQNDTHTPLGHPQLL